MSILGIQDSSSRSAEQAPFANQTIDSRSLSESAIKKVPQEVCSVGTFHSIFSNVSFGIIDTAGIFLHTLPSLCRS